MKLRAIITFDAEVENLREAAKWEEQVETIAKELSLKGYQGVTYDVKERRDRAPREEIPRLRRVVNA